MIDYRYNPLKAVLIMNTTHVMELIEANQNEKGILKWKQKRSGTGKLESFGIGLTALRKLAKQIGRDHMLAQELWTSDVYDARIIAVLIDDPKKMTRAQAEAQVEEVHPGHLAHVFSSCGAPLAKTPFVAELLSDWVKSKDAVRRSCGYGLLYEVSKSKKKSAPDDTFFLEHVSYIGSTFFSEDPGVQVSMGGALMGIGKRNRKLNAAALKVAERIGPIPIASESGDCDPFDVVKHLTSDYLVEKLGL